MAPRPDLQTLLLDLLGTSNVYFQPPTGKQLNYPAIVYERSAVDSRFANNRLYKNLKRYQVKVIDRDPDSGIPDKVALLPLCVFTNFFVVDNLNHDVFNLYY